MLEIHQLIMKKLKILCSNGTVILEDYNVIQYDNIYVKTNGKVKLGAINVQNDLSVIADEIDSEINLFVDSNNQNYKANKISIKHGFLDAENIIKINAKDLKFYHSGISSKNLIINSDNLTLFHIRNFELDNLIISSNKVEGNDSTIMAKSANIISNDCKDINIVTNQITPKNKVKVKV